MYLYRSLIPLVLRYKNTILHKHPNSSKPSSRCYYWISQARITRKVCAYCKTGLLNPRNSAGFRNAVMEEASRAVSARTCVQRNVIVEIYVARKQVTCQNAKRTAALGKKFVRDLENKKPRVTPNSRRVHSIAWFTEGNDSAESIEGVQVFLFRSAVLTAHLKEFRSCWQSAYRDDKESHDSHRSLVGAGESKLYQVSTANANPEISLFSLGPNFW